MKTTIKKILHKKNLYYPLKYSRLFHLYQLLFKPTEIRQQKLEIAFYKSFLPACDLIFDIGANDGHKTEAFLKMSGKVVCCEPDSGNFKILQTRFRNKKKRVFIENKAISDKEGYAEFHIHHPGSAVNTLSTKWVNILESDNLEKWNEKIQFTGTTTTQTVTLDKLISQYGIPDFIKIDVEGFEQWVLKGLSQKVSCLSFEALLPDCVIEMENCLSMIHILDAGAIYNIAQNEKLLLPDFISLEMLSKWFKTNPIQHIEIIVKMNA